MINTNQVGFEYLCKTLAQTNIAITTLPTIPTGDGMKERSIHTIYETDNNTLIPIRRGLLPILSAKVRANKPDKIMARDITIE